MLPNARKELLASLAPRYRSGSRSEKRRILDEVTAATGYHRKSALRLLHQPVDETLKRPIRRRGSDVEKRRRCRYDDAVQAALEELWEAAGRICSKRLVPFLEPLMAALERHGRLTIERDVRECILSLSPASADRLLKGVRRRRKLRRIASTKPDSLFDRHVRVQALSDRDYFRPRFVETDFVAAGDASLAGTYLHSVTLTDVSSGWTECVALFSRDHDVVVEGRSNSMAYSPFPLLRPDTDDGRELVNHIVIGFCEREELNVSPGSPNRSNDRGRINGKDGAVVRRFVGYDRHEGWVARGLLTELYRVLCLYLNFFQPSMKLLDGQRGRSKLIKSYGEARTPYERILASSDVHETVKSELKTLFATLDPLILLDQIRLKKEAFRRHAHRHAQTQDQGLGPCQTNLNHPMRSAKPAAGKLEPTFRVLEPAFAVIAPSDGARANQKTTSNKSRRVPHTWRTRPDPFASVWPDVESMLLRSPQSEPKTVFLALQKTHPGLFTDGQLRTFQRRIKAWRSKNRDDFSLHSLTTSSSDHVSHSE